MRLGVFTALLANLSLDQVIARLQALGISTVELGTGNYNGDPHCKLSMLEDPRALEAFQSTIADQGIKISALSCHGDPLHPNAEIARANQETNRRTILLAEKLGVPVVVDFSGCPGDSDSAKYPNWVTCAWPPHFRELLAWQWEQKVIPYWKERAQLAADHGVKIALEMHPGFVVYSPETLLRLREACGPNLGATFDPSHLFWQGIDPIAAVRILGEAIFYVHAKDSQIYGYNLPKTGVLDTKKYTDEKNRAWIFRTVGYGHGADWWGEFISTLRMYGYDYVLSIEHEDSLMSAEEGLSKAAQFLQNLVIREKPGVAYWA
ncbi:MAG: sugar phosphate isomerase/epimerase [Bryobacteraceae bacterium]|jgi:sugar phosphate isomerase/epimerase